MLMAKILLMFKSLSLGKLLYIHTIKVFLIYQNRYLNLRFWNLFAAHRRTENMQLILKENIVVSV